jgi:hypothetical protein
VCVVFLWSFLLVSGGTVCMVQCMVVRSSMIWWYGGMVWWYNTVLVVLVVAILW